MTGFAAVSGQAEALDWQWEVRSVNGRGLDVRCRLPEGLEALDSAVRKAAQARLARGSVQVSLRFGRERQEAGVALNVEAVGGALKAAEQVEAMAQAAGVTLAPVSLGDVLAMRGVLDVPRASELAARVLPRISDDIAPLLDALVAARQTEGAALTEVLAGQIAQIAALTEAAADTLEARAARSGEVLRGRVAAVMATGVLADPERLEQELAMIAVKSDVTEELDRLRAHVGAAREMIAAGGAVGRRLDFLTQEFNREANTLCSKSQDGALTAIGLDLKVVVDQMREQCANVE